MHHLSDDIVLNHPKDPLTTVILAIEEKFPQFAIHRKKDSWICKTIAFFIQFFNPDFMTQGSFAFMKKVYITETTEAYLYTEKGRKGYCATLTHEFLHMLDQDRDGQAAYSMAYLFPQDLAVLALFAFGAFLWWPAIFFLLFLGFLAPIGARWRLEYEVRGYAVGLALTGLLLGPKYERHMSEFTAEALKSPAYYYMTKHKHLFWIRHLIASSSGPFEYPEILSLIGELQDGGHFYADR